MIPTKEDRKAGGDSSLKWMGMTPQAPWTKNWISHDFFVDGGVLELELGPAESAWGTHVEDLPPSLGGYRM